MPEQHIHKWRRLGTRKERSAGGNIRFVCADSNCFSTSDNKTLLGKQSLCNRCDNVFTLTADDLQRKHPMCLNCANTKRARQYQRVSGAAAKLFEKLEDDDETELGDGI